MFVPEFSFTVTERDPDSSWIVLGQKHYTIALEDGVAFVEWAAGWWPEPRWTVQLDPWQLRRL